MNSGETGALVASSDTNDDSSDSVVCYIMVEMNGWPTTPKYRVHPLNRVLFLIVEGEAKRRPSLN
jgi:hypothetical protein